MILDIITILGIKVIFADTRNTQCPRDTNGCWFPAEREIHLNYESDNINRTVWHEIGHAMFDNDKGAKEIIKHYPPLRDNATTSKEKIADYFARYNLNKKEFSIKYPCLYIFFRDRVDLMLNIKK